MTKHEGVLILSQNVEDSLQFLDSLKYTIQVLHEQIGINFSDLISAKSEEFKKESCHENEKRIAECFFNNTKNENTDGMSFDPTPTIVFVVFLLVLVAIRVAVYFVKEKILM